MRDVSVTHLQKLLAVFFAVAMVSSASVGVVAADDVTLDEIDDDEVEPADEIYVTDDGAVLMYESESDNDSSVTELSLGGDVSTGLVDIFFESEYGDEDADDIEGELGLELNQDSMSGVTDLTFYPEDEFDQFEFSANGEHTQDASEFGAEAYLELNDGFEYPSASTSGDIVVGSDSFEADMSFELLEPHAGDFDSQPEVYEFSLTETADGYDVTIAEDRPVNSFQSDQWDTEEDASEALQQQYAGLAHELDATVDVTIHSHEYTEGDQYTEDQLVIEYTVELSGVGDTLGELVAEEMANDPTVDLSDEEVDAVSEAVNDLHINHVEFEVVFDDGEMSFDVSVSFENYEEAMVTFMDAVAEEDGMLTQEDVDDFETTSDARAAADLTQTMSWDGELEPTAGGAVMTADIAYDAENWGAYVNELDDRGIDHEMSATFNVDIVGDGDEVDIDATFDVDRDDLIDEALEHALAEMRDDSTVDEDALSFLEAFEDSDVQVAKGDIVFGEETIEIRAAGQFDDLSAFKGSTDEIPSSLPVTHVYGHDTDDTDDLYVTLEGVDADADDFSESAFADDDTDVHAAGDWDRDLPEMDTQEVADYLGVELEDDDESDDSIPGFGVAVALASIVGAALVATRLQGSE